MESLSGRNPVGGVRRVLLYGAEEVTGWTLGEAGCTALRLRPGAEALEPPLAEERSDYAEEIRTDTFPPTVRHRLRLVMSGWQGRALAGGDFLRRAATGGFVAVIEAVNGARFVAGRSARLGGEQPLRLEKIDLKSGSRRMEPPESVLSLVCTDDAPAPDYNPVNS